MRLVWHRSKNTALVGDMGVTGGVKGVYVSQCEGVLEDGTDTGYHSTPPHPTQLYPTIYLRQHSSMSSPNTVMCSNKGMNRDT